MAHVNLKSIIPNVQPGGRGIVVVGEQNSLSPHLTLRHQVGSGLLRIDLIKRKGG